MKMPFACSHLRLLAVGLMMGIFGAFAQVTEDAPKSTGAKEATGSGAAKTSHRIEQLHSSILGEERRALVRLPRHYDSDTSARYPVLYKLDGDDGLRRYEESIDILTSLDAMPDLIVVVIPNARGQRNRDMTPSRLHQEFDATGKMGTGEMGRGDRFLEFLEHELVPQIERRYRTASPRILAGHSRSALLVVDSLISKPDLFQARFVFSAPLLRDERRLLTDARTFLAAHPGHRSFIYFNWGEAENDGMAQSYAAMRELLQHVAPKGLRWVVERARGANHQDTPLRAVPAALYESFQDWRAAENSVSPTNRTARWASGSK